MKKFLLPLLVFAAVLILAILLYVFVLNQAVNKDNGPDTSVDSDNDSDTGNDNEEPTASDKAQIEFIYVDGAYQYRGTVEKPTPCHTVEVDSIIMESFPEQVRMEITVESGDEICVQVISEEEISGEIKVSDQALIDIYYNGELVERDAAK